MRSGVGEPHLTLGTHTESCDSRWNSWDRVGPQASLRHARVKWVLGSTATWSAWASARTEVSWPKECCCCLPLSDLSVSGLIVD